MTRSARRRWFFCGAMIFGAALVLLTPTASTAKQGVVKTREGRTIEGDIDEKADVVVVTVRGIPTSIPRESVDSIEYKGSIEDQYKERLAKLPQPVAAADHLDLAHWLLNNKAYDLAMQEVSAAQRIDPNSSDAATLQQTIMGQMRLDHAPRVPVTPRTPPGVTVTTTGKTGPVTGSGYTASMHKYITPEQINTIRQMEWPADDNSVRVTFNGDVKRRYLNRVQENTVQFNAMSQVAQAKEIIQNGTPEELKDVRVLTDPAPLAEYKRGIQATILTNCATAGCHGGPAGGKFFLYANPESDAATYTNFYLLTQATTNAGGTEHLMIDRAYPDQSLLALWGLPGEVSKMNHPTMQGVTWRTVYRSKDDAQYKNLISWINKLVPMNFSGNGSPVPQYGFPSPLPPLAGSEPPPATAPATKPPVRGRVPATRPAKTR